MSVERRDEEIYLCADVRKRRRHVPCGIGERREVNCGNSGIRVAKEKFVFRMFYLFTCNNPEERDRCSGRALSTRVGRESGNNGVMGQSASSWK